VPTLRISHTGATVEIAFEDANRPRLTASHHFASPLTPQDSEDIRWYLEDYLVYPLDPAPVFAARIETRLRELGIALFNATLAATDPWLTARQRLGETRIEIETSVPGAAIPWELLRDPATDLPLALHVPAFIRGHSQSLLRPEPIEPKASKIRILLAICRPAGDADVPFRSVARHLLRGLGNDAREHSELELLRPPTYEQLAHRLRAAKAKGEPFHVLHFDGHGAEGAIYFENPSVRENARPVPAADLARLLNETAVPVLILNACRSAFAEPPQSPRAAADIHEEIREFGSLAHTVMDYGASAVVAWRYNVFVTTAAQFMLDFYSGLASGIALAEAATIARKQLSSTGRPVDGKTIEDWTVPAIFESAPVRLFPQSDTEFHFSLDENAASDSGLPQAPDIGFIGRDESILNLDRAFDEQSIVLLHAYAGSGKTSTAAEFARWYEQTSGVAGPILFTSFEQHKTLPAVLDQLGRLVEGQLTKSGVQWLTLTDEQRRTIALQVMQQLPVLWIWDNVEPIAGFPAGTSSLWTETEQSDLVGFLAAARSTKAKFLLTSRRDEHAWLHDLPVRVELPPMTFEDRVRMTEGLARRQSRKLAAIEDWRPLLRFTQGNPLTLTVLVGQALRDGLHSRQQIEEFVEKLRAGEADFRDEIGERRTRSLAASLAYGFENAFTEAERKQLALLHLFQGVVLVDALLWMGVPEAGWCLPEVRGIAREYWIALLDRAAEIGLLTSLGGGYYTIHPALPWFFGQLFQQYYGETRNAAMRAFVEAEGELGTLCHRAYNEGNRAVTGLLAREEPNLLQARRLARRNGWWSQLISAMQGLDGLYEHTGRRLDWTRLVEEIVPDFVQPESDLPIEGREDGWPLVMQYRIRLAIDSRRLDHAERLQQLITDWHRRPAESILARPSEAWTATDRNRVRSLSVSLAGLARIQLERGSPDCVVYYRQALAIDEKVGDSRGAAIVTFKLGSAYSNVSSLRDFAKAEEWYRRSLDLQPAEDAMMQGQTMHQLGMIEEQRFDDLIKAKKPKEAVVHFEAAVNWSEKALEKIPPHLSAGTHSQLGRLYSYVGELDSAFTHLRMAIRYQEALGDRFGAGHGRHNTAIILLRANRLAEAREWAHAALRDFEASENADHMIPKTTELIRLIESALAETSPPQ
jgi:tetratricopeptide (TPR) repeat protein